MNPYSADTALHDRHVAALNRLRNAIISAYGCFHGCPRINLGPCGRFARDFREAWNARFHDKINIVFVMSPDGNECQHVMVRLPDGSLYDGGYGVVTEKTLTMIMPGVWFDEMTQFDLELLDKWSYGLTRNYPNCPDYSDELTRELIRTHLSELPITNPEIRNQTDEL